MTGGFVGRSRELAALQKRQDRVAGTGEAVAVTLRGLRQVGKSRLVQEHCNRAGLPYFYFAATKGASPSDAIARFCAELKESDLPEEPELVPSATVGSWLDAFRLLAGVLPARPAIVVVDELPWLAEQDEQIDGAVHTAWDRLLRHQPVLLILLGSDLHMMERFTAYDRPFFGRADNMVLGPLNPAEIGDALGLAGADAVEAHLASGGLPGVLASWPAGTPVLSFLSQECADPAAPVFSIPEAVLLAEFPQPDQARRVLEAVGSGDRAHAAIAAAAGGRPGPVSSGSLSPLLHRLVEEKRVLARDEPVSTRPGKPALYRVADSNLRLYLAMLRDAQDLSRRGRTAAAAQLIERRWPAWRGRAVEPLVRESLELALADGQLPWPRARKVGGWWNRQLSPEVDLVGADREPVADEVSFTGSIKWIGTAFDDHDLDQLIRDAGAVPGAIPGRTGVVVASRSGSVADPDPVDLVWGPAEVVAAWR